ncbi:MAG: hypothetical protein Q9175_007605 [Cornicularia normoerica]
MEAGSFRFLDAASKSLDRASPPPTESDSWIALKRMNQTTPASYIPLHGRGIPQEPTTPPTTGRVECTIPGCGKLFK